MGKNFVPDAYKRKENKMRRKMDRVKEVQLEQAGFVDNKDRRVQIRAFDPTVRAAIDSWLGFKPKRAVMVSHVVITTDIPISRERWLEVVTFLENCIMEEERNDGSET